MARKNGNGKSTDAIYQEVTDRIVASLEEDIIPWHRPWKGGGIHANFASKHTYRGINPFLLELTCILNDYTQPWWVTFKQAKAVARKQWLKANGHHDNDEGEKAFKAAKPNGGVRKGEKSTLVVFWKMLRYDLEENGRPVRDKDGKKVVKTIPLLRYYNVFNVEQCDGIEVPPVEGENEFTAIERAQAIIDNFDDAPPIKHGGERAYYRPSEDKIGLPKPEQFNAPEHYYCTAYHELVHSTGHKDRLNREEVQKPSFGSDPYAKEELVAEMGAAMIASFTEIDVAPTVDATKAYIRHWIERFKEDKKLLIGAAGKAQQAADYIIGPEEEVEAEEAQQEAVAA